MSYDKFLKENVPQSSQEIINFNVQDYKNENNIDNAFENVYKNFLSEVSPETMEKAKEITSKYVYDMYNTMGLEDSKKVENNNVNYDLNNKMTRFITGLEAGEKYIKDEFSL